MTFDIPSQHLKCGRCDRELSIPEADRLEARHTESTFSADLLTCPSCGAEIRALNAAAASFCSYCGSSVMLEKREAAFTPPEEIIPFKITREECFARYRERLQKSLCADHRLKKNVTAESFRGIYVPFHTYRARVQGNATLKGTKTSGNTTYYYDTRVELNHQYEGILHDASREFPDAMSRQISNLNRKKTAACTFSPAYLSGFYADEPDTSASDYLDYARTVAVRQGLHDVISDMKDGCTYSTLEAEQELLKVTDAEYTGVTMAPVWFMAMRSGKRVLYAVQNAVTGEMAADIPMDYPRFGLFALILAVPLFFLLNALLTLRPEMVMMAAMALAVIAQLIVGGRLANIASREAASRSSADFDVVKQLKELKKLEKRAGKSLGGGSRLSGALLLPITFAAVYGFYFMSQMHDTLALDSIALYKIGAAVLTLAMGGLVIYQVGRRRRPPAGSVLAFLAMLAGAVILILDPFRSDDLPVYLVSFLCMAAVIWESLDLILLYNRECSSPLPQFESHQGGDDRA